jgi:hypothetical protein
VTRNASHALLLACLALPIGACSDRGAPPPPRSEAVHVAEATNAALEPPVPTTDRLLGARHRGVRRVEIYAGGASPALAFRESIVVAGDGRFGLEPIEALTPVSADWEYVERVWARFSFRYRDFAVRDMGAFLRNWRLVDLGQTEVVAGRTGARYVAEREVGEPVRYELVVDPDLGLMLKSSKYDAAGTLLRRMEYESLELEVDLESAVWTESAIDETALDPGADLREQVGAALRVPLRIPQGFELREASTARFDDREWLRLVYDDGVEPVFFLSTWSANEEESAPSAADRLLSARLGPVTVVQTLRGAEVLMGVGAIGESDLADLVESALP